LERPPGRRNKLLLVQIELYEIQGLDLPASTTLDKFGFHGKGLAIVDDIRNSFANPSPEILKVLKQIGGWARAG